MTLELTREESIRKLFILLEKKTTEQGESYRLGQYFYRWVVFTNPAKVATALQKLYLNSKYTAVKSLWLLKTAFKGPEKSAKNFGKRNSPKKSESSSKSGVGIGLVEKPVLDESKDSGARPSKNSGRDIEYLAWKAKKRFSEVIKAFFFFFKKIRTLEKTETLRRRIERAIFARQKTIFDFFRFVKLLKSSKFPKMIEGLQQKQWECFQKLRKMKMIDFQLRCGASHLEKIFKLTKHQTLKKISRFAHQQRATKLARFEKLKSFSRKFSSIFERMAMERTQLALKSIFERKIRFQIVVRRLLMLGIAQKSKQFVFFQKIRFLIKKRRFAGNLLSSLHRTTMVSKLKTLIFLQKKAENLFEFKKAAVKLDRMISKSTRKLKSFFFDRMSNYIEEMNAIREHEKMLRISKISRILLRRQKEEKALYFEKWLNQSYRITAFESQKNERVTLFRLERARFFALRVGVILSSIEARQKKTFFCGLRNISLREREMTAGLSSLFRIFKWRKFSIFAKMKSNRLSKKSGGGPRNLPKAREQFAFYL